MSLNFIYDNIVVLKERHYVIKSDKNARYWATYTRGQVQHRVARFGENFCLVVTWAQPHLDAYIFPYAETKEWFSEATLYDGKSWKIWITNNEVHFQKCSAIFFSAAKYYNAVDFLGTYEPDTDSSDIAHALTADAKRLREIILAYNRKYREVSPTRKRTIAQSMDRPGAISEYLKQLHGYRCQLCGIEGFEQRNGSRYAETHHIEELHNLIPGSYCSDNIAVLCANCHVKMHFGRVSITQVSELSLLVTINDIQYQFQRNVISLEHA